MSYKDVNDCITKCTELKDFWRIRDKKFKDWYDLLLLKDQLEQENMETVVTNDPRTGYNLALHLLISATMAHRVSVDGLDKPELIDTGYLENFIERRWRSLEREEATKGRQSWLRRVIELMLATGWYSVFVQATEDRLIAEIWNPANVYPEFGESGLESCAHVYTLKPTEAIRKAKIYGIQLSNTTGSTVMVYSLFQLDEDGDPTNTLVIGDKLARPKSKLSSMEQVGRQIPVLVSPVSGLPDTGVISSGNTWQEHFGESIVAVNAEEFSNNNKMQSFIQQLVRDSANPRWFEKSRSQKGILQPERIFKRGAIFRGAPDEDIMPLPTVPIPVEIRTILMDYNNRIQRGLFPWTLYGNLQQQMSGYLASQINSAALSTLAPYSLAIRNLLSMVDNFWVNEILERKLNPYGFKKPYNIEIPGSTVQRATTARMLNPTFRLSFPRVSDMLFPEIKDVIKEQAMVNKDEAMMGQVAQTIAQIIAYREEAKLARESGDVATDGLFTKAADALEAQLGAMGGQQAPPNMPSTGEVREVLPREEYTEEGM